MRGRDMTKKRLSKKRRTGAAAPAGVENKPLMRAMQELRRSNAAGAHVPKPRRGARGAAERAAIDEQRRDMR